jgi:hypothetical protein
MRGIWRHRWHDAAEGPARDIRFALRALLRVKGIAATSSRRPRSASPPPRSRR